MKILLIADEESKILWDYFDPERLEGVELILSAGDLKSSYLEFLVTMLNIPLLYIHGTVIMRESRRTDASVSKTRSTTSTGCGSSVWEDQSGIGKDRTCTRKWK